METEYYTIEVIDEAIAKMLENRFQAKLTSIELITMLRSDESLSGHQSFYVSILKAIMDGEDVSYPELEQFLILQNCLIETYNELNNK